MDVRSKRMIGVPVRTKSGQALGRVVDLFFDAMTGRLSFIDVRTGGFLTGALPTSEVLHIAWSQIISLSEKEVIVVDATVTSRAMLAINPE